MTEDRNIANVSPLRAAALTVFAGAIVYLMISVILARLIGGLGWGAVFLPTSLVVEILILASAAYWLLVISCLAAGGGGLLKIRRGHLIYLGVFRLSVSEIERLEIRHLGPTAVKSAVAHLKSGGKRNFSLALAGASREELQRLAAL